MQATVSYTESFFLVISRVYELRCVFLYISQSYNFMYMASIDTRSITSMRLQVAVLCQSRSPTRNNARIVSQTSFAIVLHWDRWTIITMSLSMQCSIAFSHTNNLKQCVFEFVFDCNIVSGFSIQFRSIMVYYSRTDFHRAQWRHLWWDSFSLCVWFTL